MISKYVHLNAIFLKESKSGVSFCLCGAVFSYLATQYRSLKKIYPRFFRFCPFFCFAINFSPIKPDFSPNKPYMSRKLCILATLYNWKISNNFKNVASRIFTHKCLRKPDRFVKRVLFHKKRSLLSNNTKWNRKLLKAWRSL